MSVIFNRVGRPPNTHSSITLSNLALTRSFHSGRSRGKPHSVLFFVSGVFHFARTNSRISTLLNHVPSTINCRPALTSRVNRVRRHVASAGGNSVASIRTMCIPTSSLASPTPTAAFARLSTAAMLDQGVARVKVCPTISPLRSASHVLSPLVIKRRRCSATRQIGRVLRHGGRLRSVVSVLNVSRLSSRSHLAIGHTHHIRHFLSRPFTITRRFANIPKTVISVRSAVGKFGVVLSNRISRLPRRTFLGIKAVRSTVTGNRTLLGTTGGWGSVRGRGVRLLVMSPRGALFSRGIRCIRLPKDGKDFTMFRGRTSLVSSLSGKGVAFGGRKGVRRVAVQKNFMRMSRGRMSMYIARWVLIEGRGGGPCAQCFLLIVCELLAALCNSKRAKGRYR